MDDEMLSPSASSFFPPSPPFEFSQRGHQEVLEFASCEVPEQWLLGDIVLAKSEDGELWPLGSELSLSPDSELSELPRRLVDDPAAATMTPRPAKRRGRNPGVRHSGPIVSHVQAERQRRDKLNRRFCELRAAVPTVSRMDKASLLADAAAYIAELRSRVARLENEGRQAAAAMSEGSNTAFCGVVAPPAAGSSCSLLPDETVHVRMVGGDAALVRLTTAGRHAPARLMSALRSLELEVQHACVSRVLGMTVQDVVVSVPAALQHVLDDGLRSALLQKLKQSDQL